MKKKLLINLFFLLLGNVSLFAQKIISEGIINYNIDILNTDKPNEVLDSAVTIIYLKGKLSRTDMINSLGNETTILDTKAGGAVILKQYSGQKLMITLTKDDWNDKYNKYNGIVFQPTAETKDIAGYTCKKAIAQLKDGDTFFVYYAPDVNVINKEYDPIFKNLPGLPVQYEFQKGKLTFRYTISAINLNPVPASKFDMPKSGYRVITYDESQRKVH
jgi:GLPGLI family protein